MDRTGSCCSVSLIVTGETLEPSDVSRRLGIQADRTWQRGEPKSVVLEDGSTKTFDSLNERSGWKAFRPPALLDASLDEQLQHWMRFIAEHRSEIELLIDAGCAICLDCFTASSEQVHLPAPDLRVLSAAGVNVDFTFACQ